MPTKLPVRTHNSGPSTSDEDAMLSRGAQDDGNLGARSGTSGQQQTVLAAARELLTSTVEAINPGTPAREMLACLTRYRASLADLVAAYPVPGSGDGA